MSLTISDLQPQFLEAGLRKEFFESLQAANDSQAWRKLCLPVKSTQLTETYGWLGGLPGMNRFVDERQADGLTKNVFSVTSLKWESTIAVDRDALRFDQYGQVLARVRAMAANAANHPNELLAEKLANGEAYECYDGKSFFDTERVSGASGKQDNKGTYSLTDEGLKATRQAMALFKNDKGKFLGVRPDTLIVPPSLEDAAITLVKSRQLSADGMVNVHEGRYDIIVLPELEELAQTSWYLAQKNFRGLQPFVFQDTDPVEFGALEGQTESGFMRETYYYGIRAMYAVTGLLWFLAFKNTPAA